VRVRDLAATSARQQSALRPAPSATPYNIAPPQRARTEGVADRSGLPVSWLSWAEPSSTDQSVLDNFSWPACGNRTSIGPCSARGEGLGGRCASHSGAYLPSWVGALVLLARLRTEFAEAVPLGPARLFAMPERVWTQVAVDGEWPQHLIDPERRADGIRKRQRGVRQPIALERGRGNWPQVIGAGVARRLLERGSVSRVIATTTWLDAWWLAELLPGARIELRHAECSDAVLAAELERRARADYRNAVRLGWAWT
jgi:hypothetical protein